MMFNVVLALAMAARRSVFMAPDMIGIIAAPMPIPSRKSSPDRVQ